MGVSKEALAKIQKLYGKESVRKMSDTSTDVEFSSSGSLELDYITGGGFPKGRIIEVYGPESSGKTTCTLHAIAEVQKAGGNAGFIDAEHAMDPAYAAQLGVNVGELVISQPDDGEQGLNIAKAMIESGEFQIVVIDSTSALVPKSELEGEVGDSAMGKQARMMSQALRMITAAAKNNGCIVIFISQLRENIGPYGGQKIGVGNAMKFYASQRISIRKSQPIMEGGEAVGHTMIFETKKNKVYPPFKNCEVILRYGKGYDSVGEILSVGVQLEILERKGAWYAYEGENIGNGKEKTIQMLNDNPELLEILKGKVTEALKQ